MASNRKGKEGNVLKVVELGIEDKVYNELKKPDYSAEALARKLTAEGVKITAQSIRKFVKKTRQAQQQIIAKDMRAANEVVKLTMDYQKALKDILTEVEEVKNMAKEEKDMTTYNQLVGRLMQGIELIAKLTGDMRPNKSVDINIIYNEINSDIEKNMKDIKKNFFEDPIDVDYEIIKEENVIIEGGKHESTTDRTGTDWDSD